MSTNLKNILVWLAVVVSLVLLWQLFYNVRDAGHEEKDFTTFYREMTEKRSGLSRSWEKTWRGRT